MNHTILQNRIEIYIYILMQSHTILQLECNIKKLKYQNVLMNFLTLRG